MSIFGTGEVASLLKDVIDRAWPDPAQKAEAMLKVQELDNQIANGQAAINQVEAASSNLFVAGWRPFVGWTCGTAFAYNFVLLPFMLFFATLYDVDMSKLPTLDMTSLITVLVGMLGLGAMRTSEKMGDKGHLPWQQ